MIEFVRGAFSVSITRFVDPFAAEILRQLRDDRGDARGKCLDA